MSESDFEFEDAPDEIKLASIDEMIRRSIELQAEIDTAEAHLKALQKEQTQIVEKDLVARLASAGTSSFTTIDGLKVEVTRSLITSEIKDTAKRMDLMKRRAEWLNTVGGGSLIRESLEMAFEKGDGAACKRVMDALDSLNVPYFHGDEINTASFKSFVTHHMEEHAGEEEALPLPELGLYLKQMAKITLPKKKSK